ncbi:AAA family ATPase [Aliarcobacter butzleri]|uniref:AAA family ATPase n=1 Tax=Aliarcobacter butzleri TaxID=28197 RepID=UPI0021B2D42C|nr:AAA family ATPase [Aliarcobacter butzleri]MCT7568340.1 AAA family ATPase [Aliarcobacter butzleri]
MELVYLWVEDYKNIQNQGFNFSTRFRCEYDEDTKELTINENKDYVNIFPDNINITAIVGENGSGKSSLLTYLCMIANSISRNIFTCILKENLIKIQIYNDFKELKITNNSSLKIKIDKYIKDKNYNHPKSHIFNNSEFIYYSNSHLELNSVFELVHNFNFIGFLDKEHNFNLNKYHNKLNENLIYLFTQYTDFAKSTFDKFNLSYPNNILAIPSNLLSQKAESTTLKGDFLHLTLEEVLVKLLQIKWKFIINDNKEYEEKKSNENIKGFITKLTDIHFKNRQEINEEFLIIQFLIKDIFNYFEENKNNLKYDKFYNFIVKIILDENYNINQLIYEIMSFYNKSKVRNYINELLLIKKEKTCQDPQKYYLIHIDRNVILDFSDLKQELILNLKKDNYLDIFRFFFLSNQNINIEYSSGEIILIDLITQLVKYKDKDFTKSNIIFFLDEIELFLHPQWQKEYLSYFISILNFIFPTKKITIFITTHSPFILSDIPKENIIFLEKGKQVEALNKKQTFGANIHTLLSDSFFIKSGLMGEFAKEKIQSIINYHEELLKKELTKNENKKQRGEEKEIYEKEYKNKFWQIQSIIGDDYLKQVIKNHLVEIEKIVLGNDEAKEEEIKRLKAQIELLEK